MLILAKIITTRKVRRYQRGNQIPKYNRRWIVNTTIKRKKPQTMVEKNAITYIVLRKLKIEQHIHQ